MGNGQREQNKPDCVKAYQEAIPLCQLINDKPEEAICAFNLGHAYKNLPSLRNLDEAERWYQEALRLFRDVKSKNIAQVTGQLGLVAYERFNDAKKDGKAKEELLKHLNAAADYYQQALALLPPDAVIDIATVHNQLGNVYQNTGDLERALNHYNNAAKFFESAGNLYNAATVQRNVSIMLANNGRHTDALLYARAALRNFESYGGRAKDQEDRTKELIAEIEGMK